MKTTGCQYAGPSRHATPDGGIEGRCQASCGLFSELSSCWSPVSPYLEVGVMCVTVDGRHHPPAL